MWDKLKKYIFLIFNNKINKTNNKIINKIK